MSKRHVAIYILFASIMCLASIMYYQLFTSRLGPGEEHFLNFKGVILADSLMYDGSLWIAIKVQELNLESTLSWMRTYPTLLPMTVFVYGMRNLGIPSLVFNTALIFLSSLLILKTSKKLQLDFPIFALASIFLNALTVYFLQSYTKEIILLFLFTGFLYGLFTGKKSVLIGTVLCMGLIRIYIVPPIIACLALSAIRKRWPALALYRWLAIGLFFAFLVGPLLIANNPFLVAARIMQENLNATSGVAYNYLKSLQYPLVPLFFLPIKIIQNLFEPLLGLRWPFNEAAIQIGHYMAVGGALIHALIVIVSVRYWRRIVIMRSIFLRQFDSAVHIFVWALAMILISSLIMFSLLPYVQMRYLYPLVPGFGLLIDILKSRKIEALISQGSGIRSLDYDR